MNQRKRILLRRYGFALSAGALAILLLVTLLFASSVQSAGGYRNTDPQDEPIPIRSFQRSVFSYPAGLPATGSNSTNDGTTEAPRDSETTEATHPLSDNPLRRRQSADHPAVMFIENVGQFPDGARFQVRAGPGTMWLSEDAIWITVLEKSDGETRGQGDKERFSPSPPHPVSPSPQQGVNLKLTFPGANPHPRLEPFDRLDTKVSYFLGSDPDQWRPDVPVWAGVRYVGLYPGVNLEITSQGGRWTWRLVCRANCPPVLQNVRFRVEGAEELALDGESLRLNTAAGELTLPLLQAVIPDDTSLELATAQPTLAGNEMYAPFQSPISNLHSRISNLQSPQDNPDDLLYATFLGGGNGWDTTVDASGITYTSGWTESTDFPTTAGAFDATYNGHWDAFIAKLNAEGAALEYVTFLGGSDRDGAWDIAIDETGAVYVSGVTLSFDYPTTSGAYDRLCNTSPDSCHDAFVTKLGASGDTLIYSTFLGGTWGDHGSAIAVDSTGAAYAAGYTQAYDFPTTSGAFQKSCASCFLPKGDAFVTKLSPNGSELEYSTYLGGSKNEGFPAINLDTSGRIYITGETYSSDFPTTQGVFDTTHNGARDIFVARLSARGAVLEYATFLGGDDEDWSWDIAVEETNHAYVTGRTWSANFPATPDAFDSSYNSGTCGAEPDTHPCPDAFVARLNTDGTALEYATFLGGDGGDSGRRIAVDGAGRAYVTGDTRSTDFPATPGAFDTSSNGDSDAFVTRLNTDGTALEYATFLGGSDYDGGYGIAVDGTGRVYVMGWTESTDFPTTVGAFDTSYNGPVDTFVAKLVVGSEIEPPYTISGQVNDDDDNPIADATVSASGPANLSTTTTDDGTYTFSELPAGTYSVSVSLADYTFLPKPRTVSVPPDATDQDFTGYGKTVLETLYLDTFEPGNDGAIGPISSTAPLHEGAEYRVVISGTWSTWPASMWTSVCKGVPEDEPQIPSPDTTNGKVGSDAEYLFAAPEGSGPCSNPDDLPSSLGKPIEVSVDNGATWQKPTSISGTYNSEHIYSYLISGGGFPILFRKAEFPTDDNYGILKIRIAGPIPTYSIAGQVTDAAGNPIANAAVSATGPSNSSTTTASDGTYTLSDLPAGTYTLMLTKAGYTFSPPTRTVSVPPDATGVDFTGIPTIELVTEPDSVPADGTSSSTITLTTPMANHRVRLISSRGSVDNFSPASGTTDSNGGFAATVRSSTPGTAVITARDLTTGRTFGASAGVTFTPVGGEPPPPPANEGAIAITDIKPQHPLDARYLEGIPVSNHIQVAVDWKGATPDRVDFVLNGVTHSEPADVSGASGTFDMGYDLQPGQNALRIVAYNAAGQASQVKDLSPYLTATPVWLSGLISVGAIGPMSMGGSWSAGEEYNSWIKFPAGLFDLGIPNFGPSGTTSEVSFLASGNLVLPVRCGDSLKMSIMGGAEATVQFTSIEMGGELKGTGTIAAQAVHCEIPTAQGTVRIDVKLWGQKDWPVMTFVVDFIAPGAGTAIEGTLQTVGVDPQILGGAIYAQGSLHGSFESVVSTILQFPYLEWQGLRIGFGPGIEAGYEWDLKVAEFKIFFGADGTIEFYQPNPLKELSGLRPDRVTVGGEAGYEIRALFFVNERKYRIEWTYPPEAQTLAPGVVSETASGWQLLGHGYRKPYAVFRKPLPGKPAPFSLQTLGAKPQGLAAITASEVLVSNVYTYTEPSLALNPVNDDALAVWVHDDVSKPVGQNFDLAYGHWDGSTWSTPARVTDDTYLDGNPQVVWDSNGKGLAVWERLNDPALPITATLDTTTTQKIEIAWAQYDPGTDTWGAPAWLTTNSALDQKPILARNPAGAVMAAWRQNVAGLLSGDAANPDRVMFARWDGSSWSAPSAAVDDIPGLVDLAAGYGDGQATIAYTRFLTPTSSITPTLQLFTTTWDGGTWSAPQQLTDDDLGHTNPQVVYNTLNEPLLVWQAGETLRLRNLTTGDEVDLALGPDLVIDEFRLLHDPAGNLAAVFTGQEAGQRDLFVTLYDAAHKVWGRPYRLTDDVHSEGYPAPALDSTGRLLMAYAQTQISSEERTTTDPDTGETITYTLPVEGQTDLYTLSHQFVQDLTVGNLAVSDEHPQVGASVTVSATVTNTGALALDGVQVGFYEGDPDAGGTLLDTVSLPDTLAAGYTATLTTTYTISATAGQQQLVAVVDPQDSIAEADETNNRAALRAFGPDLELTGAGVDYWSGSNVGLRAIVRNIGTTASSTTTIAYRWGAITGTLAITDTVASLAAGQAITLTTPWNYGTLAEGSYTLAAIVNESEQDFAETFTANNEASLALEVLPDLAVSPLYLWAEALPDASVTITGTVYNFGSVPSPATDVTFYVDDILTDTAQIETVTVPALAPGSQTYITATWSTPGYGEHTFYLAADPQRTVTETTRSNNLASTSAASACTQLAGDVNCSCSVNALDVQEIAGLWHQPAEAPHDVDGDKWITVADIMQTAAAWGDTCQ